jgi:uncharacterized membrane protein YeiB
VASSIFLFLLLIGVISLVCSAVRRDDPRAILRSAVRLFLYLGGVTVVFGFVFHLVTGLT